MDVNDVVITKTDSNNKAIIELAALNPDTDGDGKIKPSEQAIHDLLVGADIDGDGYLSINEFYKAMARMSNLQQSREVFKKALCGLSVLFLLQTAVVAVLVVVVAYAFKDTYVSDTDTAPAMTTSSNDIVSTAEALVSLPLFVAPVLPLETLAKVKSIAVRYFDTDRQTDISVGLKIAEYQLYSDTAITFFTETGKQLRIDGGNAVVVNFFNGVEDAMYDVCEADVSCSAIKAEAEDEAALVAEANAALVAADYSPLDYTPANGNGRRRLGYSCTQYTEQATAVVTDITAYSTATYNTMMMLRRDPTAWQVCEHPKIFDPVSCLNNQLTAAIDEGDGTCDAEVSAAFEFGGVELTTKEDGSKAWCGDIEGKYNVKCSYKWGRGTQMKKFVNAGVTDAAFFCGENEEGQCVIDHYRRDCFKPVSINAAIEAKTEDRR